MSDGWEKMKRAKEDEYFDRQNKEALNRLKTKATDKPRLSPITGEPMEQLVLMGVVIDKCPTSGGIWLDAGELEEILRASREQSSEAYEGWLSKFFNDVFSGRS
jgi:Zn-finger nucleic acid-binding protein